MSTPIPQELTPTQIEVLGFLRAYFERNDTLPTTYAIAKHFGWKSQTSGVNNYKALEKKGYVERNEAGGFRFCRKNRLLDQLAKM